MTTRKGRESNVKLVEECDPESKELWLLEFEKEPVNDERWSCLVTSAIPAKIGDDESIQIYKECVGSGLRRAVKTISMSDVVNFIRESGYEITSIRGDKKTKGENREKTQKKEENAGARSPRFAQIMSLVVKYVTFKDFEVRLPPGLMAVLLKYMILKLKEDNVREKKIQAVRQRKIRERKVTTQFIRSLKPNEPLAYCESKESINDEPFAGPDLYIMLTDFFNASYFPELQRVNVPFVAIIKVTAPENEVRQRTSVHLSVSGKSDMSMSKQAAIEEFWKNLNENCLTLEKTIHFKEILMLKYDSNVLFRRGIQSENKKRIIFDELSWIQYSAYGIYCQHQRFLQQLRLQRVTLSLETLDLSECEVYNKFCDALITGQPLTPLLVLYAMVEQLVAEVPETNYNVLKFENAMTDFFPTCTRSSTVESSSSKKSTELLVAPCEQCRNKTDEYVDICKTTNTNDSQASEESKRTNYYGEQFSNEISTISYAKSDWYESKKSERSGDTVTSTALIDQVLSERKTEKDTRKDKQWKVPRLCAYGDWVTLQTYHCDPRLVDPDELLRRFMKPMDLLKTWMKYPRLPPGERAYYDFHYNSFLKISKEDAELFKIKIWFTVIMKLAGMSKCYIVRRLTEIPSKLEVAGLEDKQSSPFKAKVTWTASEKAENKNCFSGMFFNADALDKYEAPKRKDDSSLKAIEQEILTNQSREDTDFQIALMKTNFISFKKLEQNQSLNEAQSILQFALECFDISQLSDFSFIQRFEGFHAIVEGFTFYENLTPALMIQRLFELKEQFNRIQYTYFPPADNIAIVVFNESDHRGVSYRANSGKLLTPVGLRDFYSFIYPKISNWIKEDTTENEKSVARFIEMEKAKEEKEEEKILATLRKRYCKLSETHRKQFIEQEIDLTCEPEVAESELNDLPCKVNIRNGSSTKIPFVATDLGALRVETCEKIHEFYSKDGTEVRVVLSCWLYDSSDLLSLTIRRSSLWFRCHTYFTQGMPDPICTLKTESDIIFVFFKESDMYTEECERFNVKISWPTGLLIEVKSIPEPPNSNRYVKQSYLKVYRRGWEIEEEKSRCYVKNGNIIIFHETGVVTVLTGSGTIYKLFYDDFPRCEKTTMTGEVWEQRIGKTRCRNKRKKSTLKVYLGVDSKTHETYYKRTDGTTCMLWPNGKLVTCYPDGTKITTTPEFDENGETVELDDEGEENIKAENVNEMEKNSRASMRSRNSSQISQSEPFVSVYCTYLMEHPKYSTVSCDTNSPHIEIKMLEELTLQTPEEGSYKVVKKNINLNVSDVIRFNTECGGCEKSSTSVIDFQSDVLCHCVDLFENEFSVFSNGEVIYCEKSEEKELAEGEDRLRALTPCSWQHAIDIGLQYRCFILERDLSGVEFIHHTRLAECFSGASHDSHHGTNSDSNCRTILSPILTVGYESWVMKYEKDDSLPTNLKKKDLKDIAITEKRNELFKYPFPRGYDTGKRQSTQPREKIKMPKVKLLRTVRYFPDPGQVINDVSKYARQYLQRAISLRNEYDKHNSFNDEDEDEDADLVNQRLKMIAVTLSQSLTLYPHLCTQLPSTEAEIHYFGHLINQVDCASYNTTDTDDSDDLLPKCKQLAQRLPRRTNFPVIHEENESDA